MNIRRAGSLADLTGCTEFLAGGTDLSERMRSGVAGTDVTDISGFSHLEGVLAEKGGRASIGALTTVAAVGADQFIRARFPALAAAASTLATPQIRTMATMGGVLCQRSRCAYFRHPDFMCYKKGGDDCPARVGNHHLGVAFDLGPCVHPHPSSIALPLLIYEATVDTSHREGWSLVELFGDGSDPSGDHCLEVGEILTRLHLPVTDPDERAAYFRLMGRRWAEWPLVECAVRLALDGKTIRSARVALGGVANIPLRMPGVEEILTAGEAGPSTFAAAAAGAIEGATPLEQSAYKLPMIEAAVLETLEIAWEGAAQW